MTQIKSFGGFPMVEDATKMQELVNIDPRTLSPTMSMIRYDTELYQLFLTQFGRGVWLIIPTITDDRLDGNWTDIQTSEIISDKTVVEEK